ncbi:MAG TPA: multicopper oxidase domain-containing protein [Thermomicrobiaceae bacterium]|nr:multicopper oxidase domain-containing protein [Thermomicrobiaceae bacterium]
MATVPYEPERVERATWPGVATAALRAAFGVIWTIDAFLTWRAEFAGHYVGYLQNAATNQPGWLHPWFALWVGLVGPQPTVFVWLTRIIETVIAVCLLLGLARKSVYALGALFSLLIWSTAEGFSGPYTAGATNLGPALVYVLVFLALIVLNSVEGRTPYSLDFYLEQGWPGWRRVAEWASGPALTRVPRRLPWFEQVAAVVGILLALAFLFGGLESALGAPPPTPRNAAAAVTPLELASSNPIAHARDATLPPLASTGPTMAISLVANDATVEIAGGVTYQAWTFNGSVPGPTFHGRVGQTVDVTFTNHGTMQHSIDFHAAQTPPNLNYHNVNPGQTITFSFKLTTPGAFLYHCGTAPVLMHIANGMYGAFVVDPATPLPPAEASYVLVQGEWYTQQVSGTTMTGDFDKMLVAQPDLVVFNGAAFQYRDHPLPAKAGQRVRLYLVDAGPTLDTSFHVIGAIFAAVYPDGDPAHALTGVSTYNVSPGAGAVFDLVIPQPGQYPFVDHEMRDAFLGAAGVLDVQP